MAKTDPSSNETLPLKRRFLLKLWISLGGVAIAEVLWLVVSFVSPRRGSIRRSAAASLVTVGKVAEFARGSVTAFPRGHFYLVCLEDGGFMALSCRCTHLGCTVPWEDKEKNFKCPCHSSTFDIRGDVIQSPAPRALDLLDLSIENGVIFVDTATVTRRSGFDPGQVVYSNDL